MMNLIPELGFSGKIWAILLEFRTFWLDLGHIAWIWAIWQNLGQNRPQRRRSPEDGAGGGIWMDRWTDRFPCVLQDLVPFKAAALLPLNLNHTHHSSKAQVLLALTAFGLLFRLIPCSGSYFFTVSALLHFTEATFLSTKRFGRKNFIILDVFIIA